jgi:uncharacterized protein (TIGR03435 family)
MRAHCRRSIVAAAGLLIIGASVLAQQRPVTEPLKDLRFDAASIRLNKSGSGAPIAWELMPHGDVVFTNASLRLIITIAYDVVFSFQNSLIQGSSEVLEQRFDIRAKAPEPSSVAGGTAMLRALLEDRFALRMHAETRTIPLFALTRVRADRLGEGLRQSEIDCSRDDLRAELSETKKAVCRQNRRDGQRMRIADAGPLSSLIAQLSNGHVDRPIQNATGLDGLFQWDLTFHVDRNPAADSSFAPLETAIQEQLGLKLVPQMGPWQVRVIDSVQPPTEN